ncbi:MAG TPA: hypothetical protein VM577_13690, partial [Anaerovoracaceae bacterium]|nr:hypothetical protein [Anaerovoracaceae bacterium]
TFYTPSPPLTHENLNSRFSFFKNAIQPFFCFCPDCFKQGALTVFQDLIGITVCPIHRKKIILNCPRCGIRERWKNADFLHCKCGFLRSEAVSEPINLISTQTFNIFDLEYQPGDLRRLDRIVNSCTKLWNERKNPDNESSFNVQKDLYDHIVKMGIEQLRLYPGFTLNMHLSPWAMQGHDLYSLAREVLSTHINPCYLCEPSTCCSGVSLTARELQLCIENRDHSELKRIITKNLTKQPRKNGELQYYTSITPYCELIKKINSTNLFITTDSTLEKIEFISTTEASMLLNCASGTVIWLLDQGFLKTEHIKKIRGSGHRILIQKQSIANFNKLYILVGEISSLLNTSPFEVVKIINVAHIQPAHSFRGPYVFVRKDIEDSIELLRAVLKERHPSHQQNDSDPEISIECKSPEHRQREMESTEIKKNFYPTKYCPICEGPHFRINQLPRILNASPRLINYRFFRSGLIQPHDTGKFSYCSQKDISFMINHLQQHLSLSQAMKILNCSSTKLNKLINTFHIKPSFTINLPNNEVQHLYLNSDITTIKLSITQNKF